jgi:hypothetical protein
MLTSRFSVLLSTSAPLLTPTGWTFQCDVGRRLTPIHRRSQRLITLFVFNRPQERIRPHRYISCCCATHAGHPAGSRWLAQSSEFQNGLHCSASCCALKRSDSHRALRRFLETSMKGKAFHRLSMRQGVRRISTRIWRPIYFASRLQTPFFKPFSGLL